MKKLIGLLLVLSSLTIANAQTDFGLWTGIAIEKELSKKWEISLEEEARFDENVTNFKKLLTEFGVQYKVNKYYRTALIYRFTYEPGDGLGNRLVWSNTARYKLEDFTFSYRLNFQTDFNTEEATSYKIRNRVGVDYKFNKRWEIGLTGELNYSFYYYRNVLDRYRISFGADYKVNKHHKIGAGLMFQSQINTADPNKDVVLSAKYKYSF